MKRKIERLREEESIAVCQELQMSKREFKDCDIRKLLSKWETYLIRVTNTKWSEPQEWEIKWNDEQGPITRRAEAKSLAEEGGSYWKEV